MDENKPASLEVDLSKVQTEYGTVDHELPWIEDLSTERGRPTNIFTNTKSITGKILWDYEVVDIITYTIKPLIPHTVRRVIAAVRGPKDPRVRYIGNNHAKVYLCYNKEHLDDVYVGSANYINSLSLNISVRLQDEAEKKYLAELFERLWKEGIE